MARVFRSNVRELSGRRFDPEFHIAMKSACRRFCYPTAKLRSLAYFQTGGTPSTERPAYWGGSVPWVSAKDFRQFRFDDSEDHITELAVAEATTRRIDKDAMLMVCRSGILQHTLPVMICQKPTAINQDIKAFFPDNRLTAEFLATFFDICGSQMLPLICKSGATVQSVNTDELMALDIPLPPLAIQRKIVAELDAAYTAKRKADQEVAALLASIDDMVLDELGIAKLPPRDTSLAARVFTVPLKEVANGRVDAYSYHPYFARNQARIHVAENRQLGDVVCLSHEQWGQDKWGCGEEKTFPYIEIGAVSVVEGEVSDIEEVEIADAPSRARMLVREGDLLVSLTRPTRRAIAFATGDAVASTGFAVIRGFSDDVVPEYVLAILRSEMCMLQFDQRSTGGNYPAITEDQLLRTEIPVPPKPVQERIVRRASAIKLEAKRLKSSAAAQLAAAKKCIEDELIDN